MKIASWNVNSVRARLDHLRRFLQDAQPHIVLLQETKAENHMFPKDEITDSGYNVALHGQKSYNGVAILSKYPIENTSTTLPSAPTSEARYIEAFTGGLQVASIYVPNGEAPDHKKFFIKEDFFNALQGHLTQTLKANTALVWGGDYNVAPSDSDVYDPKRWQNRILCTPQERLWLRRLTAAGLYDALEALPLNNDKNAFTWWDYRSRGFDDDRGLRIDHMLLSAKVANNLRKTNVYREARSWLRPSDHAPVMITLQTA